MLKLKNIMVNAGAQTLLNDVSFFIKPRNLAVLLGASGAGKTTLLRVLAGLIVPNSGNIEFEGKDLADMTGAERAQTIGFMPQGYALFDGLTVQEQCLHPLVHVLGMTQDAATQKAEKVLDRLGMLAYAQRYPSQLSGGQQQRVALARLFCMDSKILLLDEPTSALDPANSAIVATILRECAAQGMYIVLSTQDMAFAHLVCTQAVFLQNGTVMKNVEDSIAQSIVEFCSDQGA